MTYSQASAKLRAAAVALQDPGLGIRPRINASLAWAFGPHARVAIIFVAPGSSNSDEYQVHAIVDAHSDRDREALAATFDEGSSTKQIVDWVIDALCLRP